MARDRLSDLSEPAAAQRSLSRLTQAREWGSQEPWARHLAQEVLGRGRPFTCPLPCEGQCAWTPRRSLFPRGMGIRSLF